MQQVWFNEGRRMKTSTEVAPRSAGEPKLRQIQTTRWRLLTGFMLMAATISLSNAVSYAYSPGEAPEPAEYRLDALDKFRLKAFEWRPTLDQVFEWKALNDDYTIGSTGKVSLPLVGELKVRGLTPSEFSKLIGETMRERLGLSEVPKISVQVIDYRPFYILGEVERPGEFAFRPRLTVLQAVSISGGIAKGGARSQRLDRELISSTGELDLLRQRQLVMLAERARLEADLENAVTIKFPTSLDPSDTQSQRIMRQEVDVLRLQRAEVQAKLASLDAQRSRLEKEVQLIQSQQTIQQAERELAARELQTAEGLVKRKLAVEPRRLAAQRNLLQLEGDTVRMTSALHKLQQDVFAATSAIEDIRTSRNSKLIMELKLVNERIDESRKKTELTKRLLDESEHAARAAVALADSAPTRALVYTIVRNNSGRIEELTANENTFVYPGDSIKVELRVITGDMVANSNRGLAAPVSNTVSNPVINEVGGSTPPLLWPLTPIEFPDIARKRQTAPPSVTTAPELISRGDFNRPTDGIDLVGPRSGKARPAGLGAETPRAVIKRESSNSF
jgi:protein involved in polysaccharide export with SLBB domain